MQIPQTTIKYIEKEIYKTFQLFGSQDTIKISDFLSKLELKKLIANKELIKFSKLAMVKALLFMKLKNLKSVRLLIEHLVKNENEGLGLGFYRGEDNRLSVPNQRTFSYFINHILTDREKELIELIVKQIASASEKTGILFADEIFKVTRLEPASDKYELQYKAGNERKKIYKLAKKIILPSIKFPYMRHNCKYGLSEFVRLLIHMSLHRGFAESEAEVFLKDLEERGLPKKSPMGETLLYHIKKYEDKIEAMQTMFTSIFEKIYKEARKRTNLFDGRKVNVAMDHTEIWYFGDKNDRMVINRMGDFRGTKWGFRFITISIVNRGRKYILLTLPLGTLSNEYKVVERLIEFAKERVNINVLLADRYFSQRTEFVRLFKRLGVKYVMIGKRTLPMKRMLKTLSPPFIVKDYDYQGVKTNLIIIQGRKEKLIPFITNMNFSSKTDNEVRFWGYRMDELYRQRWSIERAFADIKKFLAKTTSKLYSIRLFYLLFSMTLYNLWILGESLLSLFLHGRILKENSIKALVFIYGLLSEFFVT